MNLGSSRGTTVLEICAVAIPIVLLGIGLTEIYRIYRTEKVLEIAITQGIEEYRRPTLQTLNETHRAQRAKDASKRAITKVLPGLHDECNDNSRGCIELNFSSITRDQGKKFGVIDAKLMFHSLLFKGYRYTASSKREFLLEDGIRPLVAREQYESEFQ